MQTRVYVLMAADKTCVHVIYGSLLAAKMILERKENEAIMRVAGFAAG